MRTLKSFSFSRFNGVEDLFGSSGENRTAAVRVLSDQRMICSAARKIGFSAKSTATAVFKLALDG